MSRPETTINIWSRSFSGEFPLKNIVSFRVVDPDPDWIGSESRIRIQGQENEEIFVDKCTF
jgi:hypothetical protein